MAEVSHSDVDQTLLPDSSEVRDAVRDRYAKAARSFEVSASPGCGCSGDGCGCSSTSCCGSSNVWGETNYGNDLRDLAPEAAFLASLGCGNPTEVADLREGEVVLDLGSGAGLDVLISARRVGPSGKAYGVDMTEEMLGLALENKSRAGVTNAEFLKGHIEDIALPAESVDVVISNCVINLSADKERVFRETFRVLRPGGRLGVTDVVVDAPSAGPAPTEGQGFDTDSWSACLTGALTREAYVNGLLQAGFVNVETRDSHKVADGYTSAIIRARKPDSQGAKGGEV